MQQNIKRMNCNFQFYLEIIGQSIIIAYKTVLMGASTLFVEQIVISIPIFIFIVRY